MPFLVKRACFPPGARAAALGRPRRTAAWGFQAPTPPARAPARVACALAWRRRAGQSLRPARRRLEAGGGWPRRQARPRPHRPPRPAPARPRRPPGLTRPLARPPARPLARPPGCQPGPASTRSPARRTCSCRGGVVLALALTERGWRPTGGASGRPARRERSCRIGGPHRDPAQRWARACSPLCGTSAPASVSAAPAASASRGAASSAAAEPGSSSRNVACRRPPDCAALAASSVRLPPGTILASE
jgi:hypothetical protein